jgi:NAD(P)-dependent dehydrogenase (short-subunit alcohol dehydrogenase family)
MRFEGKIVAITGGGSGIGKEAAARFAADGASVVLGGRDLAKLEAVAREIDPSGARVGVLAGDIADPATGAALIDLAMSRFGKLDVLVNNAGVFNPKPFLDLTEAEYDWFLDTILKGKFFTAQAAARAMSDKGGAIVQTGSMWAIRCHALRRLFSCECRGACDGPQPRHRTRALWDPHQRSRAGRGRDASLQHLHVECSSCRSLAGL